jgi:hypothetical protein
MDSSRKIQPVVRKVTFAEAEEADDHYWANATEEERFNELAGLRMMVFGGEEIGRIEKVVSKRSLHGKGD